MRPGAPEHFDLLLQLQLLSLEIVDAHRIRHGSPEFVLNSPFIFEMSREFAKRLESAATGDEDRLILGWQLAYARPPTEDEIAVAMEFLQIPADSTATDLLNRWEQLSHSLLASNEFIFLP